MARRPRSFSLSGAQGALEVEQGNAERSGDFFLHTVNAEGATAPSVVIRMPGPGGGRNPATYRALRQWQDGDSVPALGKLHRKRPPIVVLSDDIHDARDVSYLEISSDEKGFTVEVHATQSQGSGPIRIEGAEDETARLLAVLYQGVNKERKLQQFELRTALKEKRGWFYELLNQATWERAQHAIARGETPAEKTQLAEVYLGPIREAGILLLKAGVPLPNENAKRWMQAFGDLPELKALSAAKQK